MMFIFCIVCSHLASPIVGNFSETTPTTESYATEGASNFTSTDFDSQQLTAMAMLLNYIQSRPEVSQKVAPVVQEKNGFRRIKLFLEYAVPAVVRADEVLQTVGTALYLQVSWMNRAFAWNASEHSGILSLEFATGSIWTPKLRFVNSVEQVDLVETYGNGLLVSSDGLVTSFLTMYTETACDMDLTNYPYDEQFCPIVLMSLSAIGEWEVKKSSLTQEILNLILLSNTWTLEGTEEKAYKLDNVSCATIVLHIKRKTVFYTVCLVLPLVIASYMNTMVFLIPPESGEKISFFVSVFVSTSVFISFFTDVMPRGLETVPNIMKLLLGVLVEGLLILLATILITRRFHQEQVSASLSKKLKKHGSSVCPLASQPGEPITKNSAQNCCVAEINPAAETTGNLTSWSVTRTSSLSAKQLDHACFIMSELCHTVFLLYLLIDSLI